MNAWPGVFVSDTERASALAKTYAAEGQRRYLSSQFQQAVIAYDRAIDLEPHNPELYNKRGIAKASLKNYPGAIFDYTMALSNDPNFYKAYINRGALREYINDFPRAVEDYTQAIRLKPYSQVAYKNRAELYSLLGNHAAALQDRATVIQLQQAKHITPSSGPVFYPYRVALVLGNDNYSGDEHDLHGGPIQDATAVAGLLRAKGFDVVYGCNTTGPQAKAKVAEFVAKMKQHPGAVSLTYYSGHGGSIDGNNYIIPVDYNGFPDASFQQNSVSVDYLLGELQKTNAYFNMIFLDACRTPLDNPAMRFQSQGKPLVRDWEMEPRPGLANTWIEYASRPGEPSWQTPLASVSAAPNPFLRLNSGEGCALQAADQKQASAYRGLYTKYLIEALARTDFSVHDASVRISYALEQDPDARKMKQHSRTQTDLTRTERLADSFYVGNPAKGVPLPTQL